MVCDGRPLVRLGVAVAFSSHPYLEIAAEVTTSDELVERISHMQPQLLLIHTRIPPSGALAILPTLRKRFPQLAVLGLADVQEPLLAAEMLREGATGIVHVSESVANIAEAAQMTLCGLRYVSPSFDAHDIEATLRRSPLPSLTVREREVFILLGRGDSNAVIATELHISLRTVETHRQRIMRKLCTHSISELILLAKRLDMIGWTRA